MSEPVDNDILRQACAGDVRAFERLVGHYYDVIFRIAFKWCRNKADAEDIAQDTCIKLARSIQSFRFESKFSSWLYRLTINVAIDYQRKHKKHQDHQDITVLPVGSDVINSEEQLYIKEVLSHVNTLPEKERIAIVLVMAEGLTHAQAAEVMQCKEGTVSSYIHQARKSLAQLKEKGYG